MARHSVAAPAHTNPRLGSHYRQARRLFAKATGRLQKRYSAIENKESVMKRTALILATVAAVGTAAVSSPAEARWGRGWGWGPGIGFGIAAGALTVGAIAASRPYYWGPGYGYYGPRYYPPGYFGGPYGYYGPRFYGYGGPGYYGW
jgi:hypothetical protein